MYASNKPGTPLCVCTTVKKLSRVLGRTYDQGLVVAGINITQLGVLRCIGRREGEPLVRVAEEMELDRTALYRALAPMIRNGWVVTKDAETGNVRTAKITTKGHRLLARAAGGWSSVQDQIVNQFGEKQYEALIDELHRLASCAESVSFTN